jgi:D-alanyl-D-alanine dipeptidase
MKPWMFFFLIIILYNCSTDSAESATLKAKVDPKENQQLELELKQKQDSLLELKKKLKEDSVLLLNNLVDVHDLNQNIWVDLKYASTDNFMKIKLYERLNRAFLQKDVAERLVKCQEYLTSIDTGLHLLIYDAVRPVSTQWKMWRALDSIPFERGKYVSNPINKSLHNYGAAIDLTICDSKGKALDMGAGFDEFGEIAYPTKESYFLSKGELTEQHIANRNLLRKVMRSQYFRNLQTEWWHFNACSRNDAKAKYQVLENEP